jgi:YD repeat-containing protein
MLLNCRPGARARRLLVLAASLVLLALVAPGTAAAVTCPNANPVVNENNCAGSGTSAWRMDNQSDNIGGYATQSSFNIGQNVPLKIARNMPVVPATKVDITVYRTGDYGGFGARLIPGAGANNVSVNNDLTCRPVDPTTGKLDCGNWNVTYTIPGSSLPASGVYVAKLRTTDTNQENWIIFVVRDDARPSKVLYVLPTATYQAYNTWGGPSLYRGSPGPAVGSALTGNVAASGTDRAVKVSFNRPYSLPEITRDRYFGPDADAVGWLEHQGYDVSYSDDVAVDADRASLLQHKVVMIGSHSEYWSAGEKHNVEAARDAGINLASIGSNTTYWKVRYEDGSRTLVCYKTVQGGGSGNNTLASENDWGPDGVKGTADDALGLDGVARTSDDHPENSTTTWRDNGAAPSEVPWQPGGRVGPDEPENGLWGNMYVGDNDSQMFPLTIPAANAAGEFSGDRVWRNAGLSTNTSTSIGTDFVGWEWDAIPTQAQYLSRQPAGVKRLTNSNTATTAGSPSWLLDEGKDRSSSPPPGQPGTVSAVKYRAPSGALVFAAGTNEWGSAMSDSRMEQATYNILSDMSVQPATPVDITLDPVGSNQPPTAAFTATPVKARITDTVQFDASGSSDPEGPIADYEWDLDGNGTFETDTGTNPRTSRLYSIEGTYDVRLRVTDGGGATDLTVRTITVTANDPPVASFTLSPNPVVTGQSVQFNGAASSDPDGTIARYEWDLDGDGTYETDTGATPSASRVYTSVGTLNIGLRVTDNGGKTAVATQPLTVNRGGLSNYGDAVLDTKGLVNYWRLGESAGATAFADSKGTATGNAGAGTTFGVTGAVAADPNSAVRFDGIGQAGRAPVDLSGTSAITVEFWLKWNSYADDDKLALELTSNFNDVPGGFLVDPNAPQFGGSFGVGIGAGNSRNTAFFTRPSAGQWHHYAFVIDTTAPAAQQITPYVDGQAVPFQKANSGTGAGAFANDSLYFMSRGATTLLGAGDLDEVALYNRTLSADTIGEHFSSYGTNRRPIAAFTMSPNPVKTGPVVTFNGSTSRDPDGSITRYQWDLDGDGTYETDSGSSPTVSRSYSTEGDREISLRVTDDAFGADSDTATLKVGDQPPTIVMSAKPNPAVLGQTVRLSAAGTSDIDGTIARYEWDLDGNGTFETDTGTSPSASRAYTSVGTVPVGLRVTDDAGKQATKTLPVTTNSEGTSNYGDAVLRTAGLRGYWRLGETTGPTFADSAGTHPGTAAGGTTFGVPGAVANDPNTALRFDGVDDNAQVALDLSNTSRTTIEFWLNWKRYDNDDRLALEFTDNFNDTQGGFIVDPNAPQGGGTFGVGIGTGSARNNVFFGRPSAGAWHHYAFVIDAGAASAQQITPYVDGQAVAYTKSDSGTGMGTFANATLHVMSRNGNALFGAGDLDELAVYDTTLTAAAIADHFTSQGTNRRPTASFTATPNPVKVGRTVTFDAGASSDIDGSIDNFQWDLDGNGTYETDTGTNPVATRSYAVAGDVPVKLRVIDDGGGTDTKTVTLSVGDKPPVPAFTIDPSPAIVGQEVTFDASGSTDPDGTITRYEWDLDGNGTFETSTGTGRVARQTYDSAVALNVGLRLTDDDGATSTLTRPLSVKAGSYSATVTGTSGLQSYWRMNESAGTTLADIQGGHAATLTGGTLGAPGALPGADPAVHFDGSSSFARADVAFGGAQSITVEFWLKWQSYANDDRVAMELTSNFNDGPGGFVVDPNAANGSFGVGIGDGASRNNVYFARPSAAAWHHYVFVMDAGAAAADQITPYVDGQPVAYTKESSGTGAGAFLDAPLYFMSRAGSTLFGAGDLDEVALYRGSVDASTVAAHYDAGTTGDGIAPSSRATAPATSTSNAVTVSYTASDGGSGLASVDLYAQAPGASSYAKVASAGAATSGSFSFTPSAGSGTYRFYTRATDQAGNVENAPGTPDATTVVDATAPTSQASVPSALAAAPQLTVSYAASDDTGGAGLTEVDLYAKPPGAAAYAKVASTTTPGATGSFAYTATAGDGVYSFYTRAIDAFGNTESAPGSAQATVQLDTSTPTSSATVAAATTFAPITVSYSAADSGTGLSKVELYAKAPTSATFVLAATDTAPTATGSFAYTPAAGNGTYSFYTIASDKAGNVQATSPTVNTTFTRDTAAPTTAGSGLAAFTATRTLNVNYTASDTGGSGVSRVELWSRGPGATVYSLTQTDAAPAATGRFTVTVAADGAWSFYTIGVDRGGNREAVPAAADTSTTVDTVAPAPAPTLANPGSPIRATVTLALTGAAPADANLNAVLFQRAPQGSTTWTTICTDTATPYTCSLNTTSLTDGTYQLRAVAQDRAANATASAVVTTTVDNTAPTAQTFRTTNAATAGRLDAGDTVAVTYSEAMRTTSILAGWSGASTAVRVSLTENGGGTKINLNILGPTGAATVNLGAIQLGNSNTYVPTGGTATFNATMSTVDGRTVTVTLGSLLSGAVRTSTTSQNGSWTAAAGATDIAGNTARGTVNFTGIQF